jgi:hypothetical protein
VQLEKELKDQREDYHAHIRQFVEENVVAHKEINKVLDALRKEIHTLKNNPIILTYDPTPRAFTTPPATGAGQSTGSYNPCGNYQRLLLYRQQLATGGGQISAMMQNPCENCPTKSNVGVRFK